MWALFSWSLSAGPPPDLRDRASDGAGSPDKSSYSIFNPTPEDQLRNLCTDRPPKANLPCTVDPGHFKYESNVLNWTRSVSGGTTTDTFLYTNPTLKVGPTNTIDLEANMAPFERVVTKSATGQQGFDGVGDLYVRGKVNLAGPDGGDFQLAMIPYVKAPTGAPGVSNRAVERTHRAGFLRAAARFHAAVRSGVRHVARRQ